MLRTVWQTALICAIAVLVALLLPACSQAQIADVISGFDIPHTLGSLIGTSEHISVLQVVKVDLEQGVITFKRVATLKGKDRAGIVQHNFSRATKEYREAILSWAKSVRTSVSFHTDKVALVCVGNSWYRARLNDSGVWNCTEVSQEP